MSKSMITVTPLETGVAVQFPKDEALNARFKARFPEARWSDEGRMWLIPGKLAAKRAAAWAAEEEAAAAVAARARETCSAARAALRDVNARVDAEGETPDALGAVPAGVVLAEEGRELAIYGGGTRWVLAGDVLWRVRGNGADGSDWSCNNVRGGIARRIPATPDLVRALVDASRMLGLVPVNTGTLDLEFGTILVEGEIETCSGRRVSIEIAVVGIGEVGAWATLGLGQSIVLDAGAVSRISFDAALRSTLAERGATHAVVCSETIRGTGNRGRQPGGRTILALRDDQWQRYNALVEAGTARRSAMRDEARRARETARAEAVAHILGETAAA